MAQPVEIEIKLNASPAMLENLRAHPQLDGKDHVAILVSTYFDTAGGKLGRGGAALRIREGEKGREQTLKLASAYGASIRRNEWNVPVAGDRPEISGFPVKARSALARLLDGFPLKPVATTRVERTTRRIHFGDSTIEIVFDVGTIQAGDREECVCELELELIQGHLSDALALARHLPLGPELHWSVSSKADRCHSLAFDLPPSAARAGPVKLSAASDVAHGFRIIAWNCFEQLLANYPLVIASGDKEGVHQTRVAIRRLRAAMNVFSDVIDDEVAPVLLAELKAAAASLGPARDLQILHERVVQAVPGSDQDFAELVAQLGVRRDAAVRSAQALLAAEQFQRLLFEFAAWLEGGEWLNRHGEAGGKKRLVPFAAGVLSKRRRKLRKVNDRLAELPDAARHSLRIHTKKLRYAADFFASLFRASAIAKQRNAFAKALGRLQDSLGELNDMAVAAAEREALFAELEPITGARQAAQLDGLLDAHGKPRRKLLKTAERLHKDLTQAPAWWKAG